MEKTISPEERIRRAEEIYYRRQNNNSVRMSSSQVKDGKEKRQFSLYKKMIIQILICVLIYLIFSLIKDANYIFSEEVLNKTKEFLSTDINFEVIVDNVGQFFQENKDKLDFIGSWLEQNNEEELDENEQNIEVTNQESNETENNEQQNNENSEDENITNEAQGNKTSEKSNTIVANTLTGIGGASSNDVTVTTSSNSNSANKTQMQLDAEYIKSNFSLTLPLKGTITSRYGEREETEIVSANHQGIDIGVNEGTTIVSAMEGTVSLVSNEGEYGTHIKIVNKDITTIYAHCSKILVKEGDTIKKGQKIALSGNTGRTTGPHLHFEIRRDNRTINPELVLDWGRRSMSIKIDLKIFLFGILFFLTKQIELYAIFMLFAFFHELGHLCTGVILGFKPNSMGINPLGFQIEFKPQITEYYNTKQENKVCFKKIIIALAGPFVNILIVLICLFLHIDLFIQKETIIYTNLLLAVFNLIPIYPLDGGRILKEIITIYKGKEKAYKLTNSISKIAVILLTIIDSIIILYIHNIAFVLIIIYLWYLVYKNQKEYELYTKVSKFL